MDKSLQDLENRLKRLDQPLSSDTSRLRLDHLIDDLASDAELSRFSSPGVNSAIVNRKEKAWYRFGVRSSFLLGAAACCALFVGAHFVFQQLGVDEGTTLMSEAVVTPSEGEVNPASLTHLRSDTLVHQMEVEESLSEDGTMLYRVERYSVVDSDIFKDPNTGDVITLQQARDEERRAPVTYF